MSSTYRPSAPSKQTVVEEGSSFKGTLTSSCPVHVHGRVEGDLETPSLIVSPSGAVHGRAKVGAVRSQGELSGEFDADSIELAGTVRDNTVIRARSLEVKLSSTRGKLQVIFGECELAIGDEPTEHDLVDLPVAKAESAPASPPAGEMPPSAEIPPAPELPSTIDAAVTAAVASVAGQDEAEPAEDDELEAEPEAQASDAAGEEPPAKRRRKRRANDVEGARTGWSQPPSQPPPAN